MGSLYDTDSRVEVRGDGTAVIHAAEGYESEGAWEIERLHDGFTVRNTGDQGIMTDPGDRYNQRPRVFATADEAIHAVIGDPQ